jgi:D-glycero-D-manno-heptose 1,7-bisphosphate phosphatase
LAGAPVDAVLLDRDGTINVKAAEGEYIVRPDQIELLSGAAEAIRLLNRAGVPVVVVTNQRGIARGRMTEADLAAVHSRLQELLASEQAHVDELFYCPHEKGACDCRKPEPEMLRRAQTSLGLSSLRDSFMIGDSLTDVEAGARAGARTILIAADGAIADGDCWRAPSLLAAVKSILGDSGAESRAPSSVDPAAQISRTGQPKLDLGCRHPQFRRASPARSSRRP